MATKQERAEALKKNGQLTQVERSGKTLFSRRGN